ncbi:heme peroxidase [Thozetella sp. PMI_491]|nr:heme peroxidase [Thozetella sp. PMI_491]
MRASSTISVLAPVAAATYIWPNKYDPLEDMLATNSGYIRFGFTDLVTPCGFGSNQVGIQNSAEWIRTAFHDAITHDAAAGTGGLDASIMYEMDRPENTGSAFNNTLGAMHDFVNVRSSAADVLALAVVVASMACGGPVVPLRVGRIDAAQAGPAGVPKPEDDLNSTTDRFATAGFTQEDMITMVACGHTLGNVHSVDFPDLVHGTPSDANVATFDKTGASFDNAVVTEYLNSTTLNPLVVGENSTTNSDMRIFSSDGNKTMAGLTNAATFRSTCGAIFERMINTVPSTVTLTDPVEIRDLKPYFDSVQLQKDGTIQLVGRIRMRTTPVTGRNPDDLSVALPYVDRGGSGNTSNVIQTTMGRLKGGQSFGLNGEVFNWFEFSQAVDAGSGVSAFNITIASLSQGDTTLYDNGASGGYPLQSEVLYQRDSSCLTKVGSDFNLTVIAAVRKEHVENGATVALDYTRKVKQLGIPLPRLVAESVQMEQVPQIERSGYVFFKGSVLLEATSWNTEFDILANTTAGIYKVEFQKSGALSGSCVALS